MSSAEVSTRTKVRVGTFTIAGILLVGVVTVLVNHRPMWWRPCQLVNINVEDATGLKFKSPVRSLGIEIGYLKSVDLTESHVALGICITAPVEVLPDTRAYIRSEGFLGDKFVKLRPLRYTGPHAEPDKEASGAKSQVKDLSLLHSMPLPFQVGLWLVNGSVATAHAANPVPVPVASSVPAGNAEASSVNPPAPVHRKEREIPVGQGTQDVQQLVGRVDSLVQEVTSLTSNLKRAINPEELRETMRQLNKTLENASRTLAPEGGLNQTAQRTLAKLEDAIEQLRDQLTRVNQGKGSVGMLLNDPSYAEEFREAIRNVNRLLSKVGGVRFVVDLGGQLFRGYSGTRSWFHLGIWPEPHRYYLIGVSQDPRGHLVNVNTTTVTGSITTVTDTTTIEPTGILITAMFGKLYYNDRVDLSLGVMNSQGTASVALQLGPFGMEDRFRLQNDLYFRNGSNGANDRVFFQVKPIRGIYFQGGIDSFERVGDKNQVPFFAGAGLMFDDEDIKLLFIFR